MINFNGFGSAAAAAAGAYNAPMYHVAPYQQQPPMWAGNGGGGAGGGAGYPQQGQGQHVQFVFQAVVQPQQQGNGGGAAAVAPVTNPNPKGRVLKDTARAPDEPAISEVMCNKNRADGRSVTQFQKMSEEQRIAKGTLYLSVVEGSADAAPATPEKSAKITNLIASLAFS